MTWSQTKVNPFSPIKQAPCGEPTQAREAV